MAAEDDLDLLAGEYVLGVLPPDERAAVERRMLDNSNLAARVAAWQERLVPLTEDLVPVTPRPQVWQQIRRSLTAARREPSVPWWGRLGLWRGWVGLATAAVLGLLAMVVTTPPPAPGLVAVLTSEDGRPVWLVSAAADEAALGARQLADSLQPGRVPELWLLPAGATRPVSLGLLDPVGANRRTLEGLTPGAIGVGALLEVSLEPPGGSPTGLPTGPVVSKGFLVATPN
jgi:anti-sigma-K factor RskA